MADNALVKQETRDLATPERTRNTVTFTPRVDIVEKPDELILLADLPGVQTEDVDVRFENGELIIHGRCQPRNEGAHFLTCEYDVGDFYRAFTIDETVDGERIWAELRQGVLTVHLPKTEAARPKRITVQGS